MKTGVKEFLETYELYKRFHPRTGAWWNGEWPVAVDVFCHVCGETGSYTIWPSKPVTGGRRRRGVIDLGQ